VGGLSFTGALLLLLLLLLALAAGGGRGELPAGGGDDSRGGSLSGPEDPCRGRDSDHVVKRWFTPHGLIKLPCGDTRHGYRHLRGRDRTVGETTYRCIGRVLREGKVIGKGDGKTTYELLYSGRRGARVVVIDLTSEVLSAHLRRGGTWTGCAGK